MTTQSNALAMSQARAQDAPEQTSNPAARFDALAALCAIARFHQIAADPATLAHQPGLTVSDALTTPDLLSAMQLKRRPKLTWS